MNLFTLQFKPNFKVRILCFRYSRTPPLGRSPGGSNSAEPTERGRCSAESQTPPVAVATPLSLCCSTPRRVLPPAPAQPTALTSHHHHTPTSIQHSSNIWWVWLVPTSKFRIILNKNIVFNAIFLFKLYDRPDVRIGFSTLGNQFSSKIGVYWQQWANEKSPDIVRKAFEFF